MNVTYGLIFCTGHSDGLHIIGEHRESNQRPAQFHPLQRDPGTEGRRDLPQRRSSINFLTDQHRQRGGGLHAVRYVTLKRHFPRHHYKSSEFKIQNKITSTIHSTTSTTDTSTTDSTRITNAMATSSDYLMKYFNGFLAVLQA